MKLAMLYEGECEGLGPTKAASKFGYSVARYFQLLHLFEAEGAMGLRSKPTGPKACSRRTEEVVRLIIRHRFLHPDDPPELIATALQQTHHQVSLRSVQRVLADYGLQKRSLRETDSLPRSYAAPRLMANVA